jgi:hypothetical protein
MFYLGFPKASHGVQVHHGGYSQGDEVENDPEKEVRDQGLVKVLP